MDYEKNYIKVPVSIGAYRKSCMDRVGIEYCNFIFIHNSMGHYLIKESSGFLEGVSVNSRAYDGPKGWVKLYVKKEDLCRIIKSTKLSRKMYPEAIEKDGNLIILKKEYVIG